MKKIFSFLAGSIFMLLCTTTAFAVIVPAPATPTVTTPTNDNTPTVSWPAITAPAGTSINGYYAHYDTTTAFSSANYHRLGVSGTTADLVGAAAAVLSDGTWYVRIQAVVNDNVAPYTKSYSGYNPYATILIDTATPTSPGAPSTSSATTNTKPTWKWTASTDAGSGTAPYSIAWSTSSTCATTVGTATTTATSFTHTTALTVSTPYYFCVKANDKAGNSTSYSVSSSSFTPTLASTNPSAPTNVAVSPNPTTNTKPKITWTASTPVSPATISSYTVEWSKTTTFAIKGSGTSTATNYTPTTALTIGTWYVRVIATDSNSKTATSTTYTLNVTAVPTTPGTPSTTTPTTNTKPTWTWTAATATSPATISNYTVEWSTSASFTPVLGTTTSTTASFTHTTALTAGSTYYFHVKANDSNGFSSAYSTAGSVVVNAAGGGAPGGANSAPNTPTSLGGTSLTNGSTTTSTQPTFSFSLSDPNASDQVAYEIQIANDPLFNVIVTDYVSENGIQGARLFTVGQGAFPGASYKTGTITQSLVNGNYYWRVKAIDNGTPALSSSYKDASIGVAFVVNATASVSAPSVPGMPLTSSTTNSPTWTWTASTANSGTISGYTIDWSTSSTFSSGVYTATSSTNSYTTSSLADGTWYVRVKASNTSGGVSTYSSSAIFLVATSSSGGSSYNTNSGGGSSSSSSVFSGTFSLALYDGTNTTTNRQNIITVTASSVTQPMYMKFANTADFSDTTGYTAFKSAMFWDICGTKTDCPSGYYTMYAKLYDANYAESNPISLTILYTASSTATTTPKELPASVYVFNNNLKVGSNTSEVIELQKYLNKNGFIIALTGAGSPGNEIARFGLLTKKALQSFQAVYSTQILGPAGAASPTGIFGPYTRHFINMGTAGTPAQSSGTLSRNLSVGASGGDVKFLQQYLKDKGYLSVEPDGSFGPKTKAAVVAFQNAHAELSGGNGHVGPKTRAYILANK